MAEQFIFWSIKSAANRFVIVRLHLCSKRFGYLNRIEIGGAFSLMRPRFQYRTE